MAHEDLDPLQQGSQEQAPCEQPSSPHVRGCMGLSGSRDLAENLVGSRDFGGNLGGRRDFWHLISGTVSRDSQKI